MKWPRHGKILACLLAIALASSLVGLLIGHRLALREVALAQ